MDSKQVIEKQENKIDLLFALFFYIMLFVDVSGMSAQSMPFRVLCGIAAVCAILKIISTRWSIGEVVFWTVMVVLGVINYWNSHELYIMLAILSLMACKDVDLQKYWKGGALLALATVLWKSALALMEWIPVVNHYSARFGGLGICRYGLGYLSGNNAHARVLVVIMLVLLEKGDELKVRDIFYLVLFNLISGLFTTSYTGIATGFMLLFVGMCARFWKKWKVLEWIATPGTILGMLYYTFVVPLLYAEGNATLLSLASKSGLFTLFERIRWTLHGFEMGFFTPLGREIGNDNIFFVDNSFAAVWIAGGAFFFAVFFVLQAYTMIRLVRQGRHLEWGLTVVMMMYVMLEYVWTKSFRNITFLFLAESVSMLLEGRRELSVSRAVGFREKHLHLSGQVIATRICRGIERAEQTLPIVILLSFGLGMYRFFAGQPALGLAIPTLVQELLKKGVLYFAIVETVIFMGTCFGADQTLTINVKEK